MPLSTSDVTHVAALARLALTDDEQEHFRTQLDAILSYINTLNTLNTDAISPTIHSMKSLQHALREDSVQPSLVHEKALMNAPEKEGRFFKVKKVIE